MHLHHRLHTLNNHFDGFLMPLLAQASFPSRIHEGRFDNQVDFAAAPFVQVQGSGDLRQTLSLQIVIPTTLLYRHAGSLHPSSVAAGTVKAHGASFGGTPLQHPYAATPPNSDD